MKATNNEQGDLYGACLEVRTRIGDIEIEQNFFVKSFATYSVTLKKLYIIAIRMDTKGLDDGSCYARIRDYIKKILIQFFIISPDHELNRNQLKLAPLRISEEFLDF